MIDSRRKPRPSGTGEVKALVVRTAVGDRSRHRLDTVGPVARTDRRSEVVLAADAAHGFSADSGGADVSPTERDRCCARRQQGSGTSAPAPIGASGRCPSRAAARGSGRSRPASASAPAGRRRVVSMRRSSVRVAASQEHGEVDALGVVVELVPVDRQPRRLCKRATAARSRRTGART